MEASDDQKKELEKRFGKKQLQILVENSMSENWISTNSQTCPNCNAAIEVYDTNFNNEFSSYLFIYTICRNRMVATK